MVQKKGGRKPVPTSSIRVERILKLMEEEKIRTQDEFAQRIGTSQQNLSRILKSEKISEQTIKDIIQAFPDYREEWLLGYDDVPTHTRKKEIRQIVADIDAPIQLVHWAHRKICEQDNVEYPLPDIKTIASQIQDYALSLVWFSLHRESSFFWSKDKFY